MLDLKEEFSRHGEKYLKFEEIQNPEHSRPDVCAFIILDRLIPGPGTDMVSCAEHDEIYLSVNTEILARAATSEDIARLVACGVRYSSEYESLCMFV